MARLSFGYLCDFRNPPPFLRPWDQFYAEMLDFIVHAENLGFEGIWLPVTHESEFFSIRDTAIMPPPLRGHIPLYIGGFSQKALVRAARLGDGYHGKIEGHADYVEKLVAARNVFVQRAH